MLCICACVCCVLYVYLCVNAHVIFVHSVFCVAIDSVNLLSTVHQS